jgi:superfamily II DNA or RNA helicase
VITPTDEAALERLVGPTTFSRAAKYADQGAVLTCEWKDGGSWVSGQVQGGSIEPYYASAKLVRAPSGRLSRLVANCTCPVGLNCKHAVALLLSDDVSPAPGTRHLRLVGGQTPVPSTPAAPPGPARRKRQAEWERSLESVMAHHEDVDDRSVTGEFGLQFELTGAGTKNTKRTSTAEPGIRVRPVIPGKNGNWVKTGVSWSSLDYLAYRGRNGLRATNKVLVLKELLALSRVAGNRSSWGYTEEVVSLEAVNSRRLWDLLVEARDLGVPLLQAGRPPRLVAVHRSPAHVTMDLRRAKAGLSLHAQVSFGDESLAPESTLLIGRPAHGVAWWSQGSGPAGSSLSLSLAPLKAPIDDGMRAILEESVLEVPRRDEERFVGEFLPTLRQRVAVGSSDQSIELPELGPEVLVLSLRYSEGHHIGLLWERGLAGASSSAGRRTLWRPVGRRSGGTENDVAVDAATKALRSMPELFELTATGMRLAVRAELEGMSAARFVTDLLPLLEAIPDLVIETAGDVADYREATAPPLVSIGGDGTTSSDWFDLTVTVTVAGEDVPFTDLFVALAAEQTHLILPSGTFFSLDRPELRQLADLIAEARDLQQTAGDGIRLSRFQASLWEDLRQLGVITAQAGEWEASVRALAEASDLTEHAPPVGLQATLRPYQLTGFNWLAYLKEHHLGGVLADDMGLGKTLQALALMCHTKESGLSEAPYLVVAPTSVVGNWAAECARFTPGLRAMTITETAVRRGRPLTEAVAGADVVFTSYSLFRMEYDGYADVDWAGLFLDEAQFAKNHRSQTYIRAKTLPVSFKVAMTGTPLENNLMELWSLLSITAPGLFSSPDSFSAYYRMPIEKKGNQERLEQLRRRIRPLMLRRTKEQVASDLPDKQEQVLELEMNPRHKKLYQTYLQRERQKVLGLLTDMNKNRFEIFRSLTLLRQASLDMSLVDAEHEGVPSTKLDALMDMLDDIVADGHRVLVFSQFTRFLNLARKRIEASGIEHCYLDGRTRNRPAVISAFQTGGAPVFLISLKAGGFGLNLTEADYCILLDPWWNPATEAQAVDRVHRIGQTNKVMVYRLVAKGTLEEKVMALKEKKAALFANVMDAGGFESGAMTAEDIAGLLS